MFFTKISGDFNESFDSFGMAQCCENKMLRSAGSELHSVVANSGQNLDGSSSNQSLKSVDIVVGQLEKKSRARMLEKANILLKLLESEIVEIMDINRDLEEGLASFEGSLHWPIEANSPCRPSLPSRPELLNLIGITECFQNSCNQWAKPARACFFNLLVGRIPVFKPISLSKYLYEAQLISKDDVGKMRTWNGYIDGLTEDNFRNYLR